MNLCPKLQMLYMNNFQEIEVLFEKNGVLAVNKPAGLPTQAPWGIESVESLIRRQKFHKPVSYTHLRAHETS